MPQTPRIAVLMETSRSFGRGVIRGLVKYTRLHDPWLFYIKHGDISPSLPPEDVWTGHGVIGRVSSRHMADEIARRKLHLVCMGGPATVQPRLVGTGSLSVCRTAFDHLRERGFTRFACAGGHGQWNTDRIADFGELAAQANAPCATFQQVRRTSDDQRADELQRLAQWLRELEKPVGLLATEDTFGRFLLDACHHAGIHVPEEIAVVGVDNDELVCEMANPPLSSVALNAERIGFEAAKLMDQMIHGKRPRKWIEVEPLGVVTRQSTDVLAIADPDVAKAVRFIRERACDGITADDVMRQAVCSERTLQLKFQRTLQRTPYQEVRRVRLERAKHLLLLSDLKLHRIAESCGLSNAQHLYAMFREDVGMTPNEFRRRNRTAEP
ncbi:MAG TPA: DNA-binding transcriptional regulator [Tepidisphaeraceae bacterium]|jgi:LacI family transcriptional regulator|nr:DNA-binding transcriptional regulator [Tepidisphaeraceae bacterium]